MPRRRQGVTGNGCVVRYKAEEVARCGKRWHLGQWAFIEIADPWDAQNLIRAFVAALVARTVGEQE